MFRAAIDGYDELTNTDNDEAKIGESFDFVRGVRTSNLHNLIFMVCSKLNIMGGVLFGYWVLSGEYGAAKTGYTAP